MATVHREPNQVKWIGVRPGHNGIQVIENNAANNAVVIIYTVPAGKLFLLFGYFYHQYATAASTGYLAVYNAVPADVHHLAGGQSPAVSVFAVTRDYTVPLEFPAGYSFRISSSAAGMYVQCSIDGILIDA